MLKLRSHHSTLTSWTSSDLDVRHMAATSGLVHLQPCMFLYGHSAILSAFVVRWKPDTNLVHMPFGEMTITLKD